MMLSFTDREKFPQAENDRAKRVLAAGARSECSPQAFFFRKRRRKALTIRRN
jgi:hypothetical protein